MSPKKKTKAKSKKRPAAKPKAAKKALRKKSGSVRKAGKRIVKSARLRKRAPKSAVTKTSKTRIKHPVVGIVTHYFPKVSAAVVKVKAPLKVADEIRIQGATTDFTQAVASMQIEHVPIQSAKKGDEIGLLVNARVREHDVVRLT